MTEQFKIEELADSAKQYLNSNYELHKLELIERSSTIGSGMISGSLIIMVAILFVFFFSMAGSFYIGSLMGNVYSGFLIFAGIFFLIGLFLVIFRKKLIEKPLRNTIIQKIFSSN